MRSIRNGMPAMSLRGDVIDLGDGNIRRGDSPLSSEVRRATANHTVTGSVAIERLWAAPKHGILFAVSYTGLARE